MSQSNTEDFMSSFNSKHSKMAESHVRDALDRELEKQKSPSMLSNSNSTSIYGAAKRHTPNQGGGLVSENL